MRAQSRSPLGLRAASPMTCATALGSGLSRRLHKTSNGRMRLAGRRSLEAINCARGSAEGQVAEVEPDEQGRRNLLHRFVISVDPTGSRHLDALKIPVIG